MPDTSVTFNIFWPVQSLYGMLRHSKVHLMQHDIFRPWGGVLYAVWRNLIFMMLHIFNESG